MGSQATQALQNVGTYQLACMGSPNKQSIDMWLNEGKSYKFISEELKKLGDYISVNSIAKYKKYRDEQIQEELMEDPVYQAKVYEVNEQLNQSIAKIQKVDMIGELANIIEHSSEMLVEARESDIKINSVKDIRMVQQTMLEAIQVYGDTMLKAQQYAAIENDPGILKNEKTTININVKSALADILKSAVSEEGGSGNGYEFIDRIRQGLSNTK